MRAHNDGDKADLFTFNLSLILNFIEIGFGSMSEGYKISLGSSDSNIVAAKMFMIGFRMK